MGMIDEKTILLEQANANNDYSSLIYAMSNGSRLIYLAYAHRIKPKRHLIVDRQFLPRSYHAIGIDIDE
jgi:hypothetical protein